MADPMRSHHSTTSLLTVEPPGTTQHLGWAGKLAPDVVGRNYIREIRWNRGDTVIA
jgi:hypothetical protein